MKIETLEKLHKIEEAKCIYDIHYCKAGIGFMFYYPERVENPEITHKFKIGEKEIDTGRLENWRSGLGVNKYYPTFEEAVEGEYQLLTP